MHHYVLSHKMNLYMSSLEWEQNHDLNFCPLVLEVLPCHQHKDEYI